MTSRNGRVLIVDAFAGPGEYSNSEPGSPVIALNTLIDHRAQREIQSEVNYFFIEKDRDRCEHLTQLLKGLDTELPPNCNYEVINSTFDETLTNVLDTIEDHRTSLAPAFIMIDPFGVSGTPMRVIGRIMDNPKSEVYISFMYRDINRFKDHPHFEQHLDELFGCTAWREGMELENVNERKTFFYNLYRSQLKANGAQYVVCFELYEGEQLVYAIFFGTKNLVGCDKMKQAIWKVAPIGDFRFRGNQLGQLILGSDLVDFFLLEEAIHKEFGQKGWQNIKNVEAFVMSDATDFHSGHLKVKTLKPMEASGRIEVKKGTRKKQGTYPNGTLLRFI